MNTKHLFEKFATPISIVVAGALIGGGIILAKGAPSSSSKVSTTESAPTNEADVVKAITTLPVLKKIGVKSKELETCITDGTTKAAVDKDIELGQKAGLRGTPHMIVMMKKDGKDIQFPLYGALDKASIEKAIAVGATPDEQKSYVENFEPQTINPSDHIQGDVAVAPATIVEYSDIDCPYCKKLHPTLQQLVDEGKIAWVYRHSPIPQLHPFAYLKATAAQCVYEIAGQKAFWEYLNVIAVQQ
jgi:protein-disulfide isomerase